MHSNGQIIRRLFRSSLISVIAASVAAMLGLLIDGVIIGRFLGEESMAAYGLVSPLNTLALAISSVLATGSQVVCAQYLGQGKPEKARRVFSMVMCVTLVLSVVLVTVIVIFLDPLCMLLGARDANANLLPLTSDYLLGMVFALPSILFLFEFNSLMRLDGDANRVVVAVAVMTVLDVVFDLLNALVLHGGMLGMGIATSVAYFIALLIMLLHFTKKDIIFRPSLKGLQGKDLLDILSTGAPSAVGNGAATIRNFLLNHLMLLSAFGGTAVASLSIMNTVSSLASCLMVGVGMTCAMIAGVILGEQDRGAAKELVKTTFFYAVAADVLVFVLIFLFAQPIAALFGAMPGTQLGILAKRGLRFFAASMLIYGLNCCFIYYTQGMRRMVISNSIFFLQGLVFVGIAALALFGLLDSDAVWISYFIGEACTLLTIIIMAAVKKKGVPSSFADYLFIKEPFGVPEEDQIELSISEASEVIPASEAVKDFCEKKGGTQKESYLLPLFVEELGNNITQYGFEKSKNRSVDVRLMRHPDGWTLRFRDNCKRFDPVEWNKLHTDPDPAANIGIRLVCGISKDVSYLSTMELNNLTIRL